MALDLVGEKFGRLLVLTKHPERGNNRAVLWKCLCDCGNKVIVQGGSLRNGHTKSCGCLQKEFVSSLCKTHGGYKLKEHQVWSDMKQRCYNPNSSQYKNYGGRGIKVCKRWKNSFQNFIDDMGLRPNSEYSIERIDNDKGYNKNNCKWTTIKEQLKNTRRNVWLVFRGNLIIREEFAKLCGVYSSTIYRRMLKGDSTEKLYKKYKGEL